MLQPLRFCPDSNCVRIPDFFFICLYDPVIERVARLTESPNKEKAIRTMRYFVNLKEKWSYKGTHIFDIIHYRFPTFPLTLRIESFVNINIRSLDYLKSSIGVFFLLLLKLVFTEIPLSPNVLVFMELDNTALGWIFLFTACSISSQTFA